MRNAGSGQNLPVTEELKTVLNLVSPFVLVRFFASTTADPDMRAFIDLVEEGKKVVHSYMHAAVRIRSSQSAFLTATVDINITAERVDGTALVVSRFQTRQPQDPVHDSSCRHAAPFIADGTATFKDGAKNAPAADLARDKMES